MPHLEVHLGLQASEVLLEAGEQHDDRLEYDGDGPPSSEVQRAVGDAVMERCRDA